MTDENNIEEEIFEEEGEVKEYNIPDITNVPIPEIVEEDVKLKTDGRNFSELSAYEKIKFASAQNGVGIKKPKSSCKYCNGTGVISHRTITTDMPVTSGDTSGTEEISESIPNPCRCIFNKDDLPKMFTGRVPISRKLERKQEKQNRRLYVINKTEEEKKRIAEKKKAKKKANKKHKKKFNKRK
jgi:hypothetical protein